jgi:hypothetical protein
MSKILRRPMFRGGPVDSRGTGITSGLYDGYADGGQIGGGTIYGNPTSDGRYGFQDPIYGPSVDEIISSFDTIYDPVKEAKQKILKYQEETSPKGYMDDPSGLTTVAPGKLFSQYSKDEQRNILNLTRPGGIEDYAKQNMAKRNEQIKNILDTTKNLPQDQQNQIFKKLNITQQDISGPTTSGVKNEITGLEPQLPPQKTRRDEILEEAALYREALGYDEAKSQAIYNALGDVAPAVFQGKNLREAAPKIFEAINKSKAFETPKDIKQAAGQLSIQRKMLAEKARAEEQARLAIYGMKNKETLTDFIKGIPGSFAAGVLPQGIEKNPTLQASLRPGGIYEGPDSIFYYAVPDAKGKGVSGLQKLG